MSNIGLDDTLPWGKYKGRKVSDIFKSDVGYLCWMRRKRKDDSGDRMFFAREVHLLLDASIDSDKDLQRQGFMSWGSSLALEVEKQHEANKKRQVEQQECAAVYEGAWGEF